MKKYECHLSQNLQNPIILIAFTILLFFQQTGSILAQISCGGQTLETGCVKYPTQSYQCIEGDFDAPSIYGIKLLHPTEAQDDPQFLIIKGKVTFTEDYTFAEGSDIIFLDNNSGFKVFNNRRLTIESSWLHGCTKLWAGVEVLNSATILARNCTFEDAKAAIILRNFSVIEATGNTFKKNVCGIIGLSPNPGIASPISILIASKKGISGNTFWGNDQLLESIIPKSIDPGINSDASTTFTNFPYAGIWIERVNALTIGFASKQSGLPINLFRDFGQNQETGVYTGGILSTQSNVIIQNSKFENFGHYDPIFSGNIIKSDAIYARNEGLSNIQTNIIGLGANLVGAALLYPGNTFSNCWLDIHTVGTNLSVTNIRSYKAINSIKVSMANAIQNSIICKIWNNQIDYYRVAAIDVSFPKPISLNILNNDISDNDEMFDPSARFGILISNPQNTEIILEDSRIYNNKIKSRSVLQGGVFWGIALNTISYLTIEQNQIMDIGPSTNLAGFYGIRVQKSPCNGLRLFSNSLSGAKIDYADLIIGPTPTAGISITNSINCILNCNETDKLNTGILFAGICDNTELSKNRFNFHERGLSLGLPTNPISTSISPQKAAENQWLGSDSPAEAFAINLASALASVFEINSSNLNSDYWPDPRKIDTSNDQFIWFTQLQGEEPSNNFSCQSGRPFGEGGLAETDIRLLNGTYQPLLNYPALSWEANWQFVDRLNRNMELQTISNSVQQYYQSNFDNSFNRLNRIYQSYLNRWKPDSNTTENVDNLAAAFYLALEQHFALEELLSEDLESNLSLYSQILSIDLTIEDKSSDLAGAVENLIEIVDQNVTELLNEIENISCVETYEVDIKTVLETALHSHLAGGVLTTQQTIQLSEIADKCRFSGGYAVVLARAFFEPQDYYEQDENCSLGERVDAKKLALTDIFSLYPNPSYGILTLRVNQSFTIGKGIIFNTLGQVINTFDIQDEHVSVPIAGLQNGIYFIEVHLDNKSGICETFIKI